VNAVPFGPAGFPPRIGSQGPGAEASVRRKPDLAASSGIAANALSSRDLGNERTIRRRVARICALTDEGSTEERHRAPHVPQSGRSARQAVSLPETWRLWPAATRSLPLGLRCIVIATIVQAAPRAHRLCMDKKALVAEI
jgi:hypothetical protein